jgi:hypothetical protein
MNPLVVLPMGSQESQQDALETEAMLTNEPIEGFEPPWTFVSALQVRCNQPLCDIGMERDRLFIPSKDSLRPYGAE